MIEIIHITKSRSTIGEEAEAFARMQIPEITRLFKNFNHAVVNVGSERHLFMNYEYYKGWRIGRTYIMYEDFIKEN